jgi:hypothetical protein
VTEQTNLPIGCVYCGHRVALYIENWSDDEDAPRSEQIWLCPSLICRRENKITIPGRIMRAVGVIDFAESKARPEHADRAT